MKILKISLITFLLWHLFSMFYVNLYAFYEFPKKQISQLNFFGKFYVKHLPDLPSEELVNVISFYTNLTGTNRGYEFFSPNVNPASVNIKLQDEKGNEIKILRSFEAEVKYITACHYWTGKLAEKKLSLSIVESLCKRILSKNPDIKKIIVSIEIIRYENLYDKKTKFKKEIINAFSITK